MALRVSTHSSGQAKPADGSWGIPGVSTHSSVRPSRDGHPETRGAEPPILVAMLAPYWPTLPMAGPTGADFCTLRGGIALYNAHARSGLDLRYSFSVSVSA